MLIICLLFVVQYGILSAQCPTGAVYYKDSNKCYLGVFDKCRSADDAKSDCIGRGGHLVSIHNEKENSYLFQHVGDFSQDSAWIGLTNNQGNYAWTDGSNLDFTRFRFDCPSKSYYCNCNSSISLPYLRYLGAPYGVDAAKWDNCLDPSTCLPYVCEVPTIPTTSTTTTTTTPTTTTTIHTIPPLVVDCPDGSVGYGSHCYEFNTAQISWYEARALCQAHNGDLASIHDQYLGSWIADTAESHNIVVYWIGLNATSKTWSDSSAYNYTNWSQSGTCLQGPQPCTCAFGLDTQWYNCWPCDYTLSFVCEVQPLPDGQSLIRARRKNSRFSFLDIYKI